MKKICTILMSIIICLAFSFNALAMDINSPYYPLSIHLSDPDEEALVMRLLRWRYEKEYLEEHGIISDDLDNSARYNDYISLSYSSPSPPVIGTKHISGFFTDVHTSGGKIKLFGDRKLRMHINDNEETIRKIYKDVPFFQDQIKKAKEYQSTRDQIAYINNFMCDFLEYGYATPEQQEKNPGINGLKTGISLMITSGKAICSGYVDMANTFLTLLDIPNCIMSSKSGHHSWNYVYVDGKWRHLDVTWNDSSSTRDTYFLIDEIHQVRSHDWTDYFTDYNQKILDKAVPIEKNMGPDIKAAVYAEFDEMLSQEDLSSLSEDYIRRAIVPKYCSKKWQLAPDDILNLSDLEAPVTRKDFCRIMAQTIEKITNKTMAEILQEKQILGKQVNFLDTDDANVVALAKLGIVAGTDANHFNPDGYVNKVQLAVFTGRIAEKVFNVDTKSQTLDWSSKVFIAERDTIMNSWYKDDIAWASIHGITDKNIPDAWYTTVAYRPDELKSYTEALDVANKLYVIFK